MTLNVFLSSNSRSGYSQDLIDLFAKPNGTRHQFRYAKKWISEQVLTNISNSKQLSKQRAMLCYLDQATKNVTPSILPVRFARIVEVREHGSTVSIVLSLEDFCKFENLASLNTIIRNQLPDLPDYKDGDLHGKYWISADDNIQEIITTSSELIDWENLINFYYETPNSKEDLPFYRFDSFTNLKNNEKVSTSEDEGDLCFKLDPASTFDLKVYQFHPKKDFPEYALQVSSDNEKLVAVNGDKRVLNTRYDLKDYRFRTKRSMFGSTSYLSFRRTINSTGEVIWEDFLLKFKIKPSWKLVAIYTFTITVSFAAPFIVRSYSKPDNNIPVFIAAAVGGLLVSIATLLKEKD